MSTCHTSIPALLAAPIVLFSACCGSAPADVSTSYGALARVAETAHGATVSAIGAREKVHGRVTLQSTPQTSIDLATPAQEQACTISYGLGKEPVGVVPIGSHACDDADAAADAMKAAERWALRECGLPMDAAAAEIEAQAAVSSFASAHTGLASTLVLEEIPFDLAACVEDRTTHLAASLQATHEAWCSIYEDPGYRLDAFRDRIDDAADRAQRRLDGAQERPAATVDAATARGCDATPGDAPLQYAGQTRGTFSGTKLAYPAHVFAGETLVIEMAADAVDPYLEVWDTTCSRRLLRDDDSGDGRNARVAYRAHGETDVIVVASAYRGAVAGGFTLTGDTAGGPPAVTPLEKQGLAAFISWAGGLGDEALPEMWRAQANAEAHAGCLRAELYGDGAVARSAVAEAALAGCLEQATWLTVDHGASATTVDLKAVFQGLLEDMM